MANSIVISSIQSTIELVPQVPQVPIIKGTFASFLACISVFHSDLIAAREYLDVPEPNDAGPLSVEPPSILIISGLFFIPRLKASISNPKPRTPDGTNTLVTVI